MDEDHDIGKYDTNPDVYPGTVGVYRLPINWLNVEFKGMEKIKEIIRNFRLADVNISHYRKSRGDGNCYYRSVGISFIEL